MLGLLLLVAVITSAPTSIADLPTTDAATAGTTTTGAAIAGVMQSAITVDEAYDEGVTALAENRTPSAIAALLVAEHLGPRDREVAAALQSARDQSGSIVHAPRPLPVSPTELGATLVVANLVFAVTIARSRRRLPRIATGVLVLMLAILYLLRSHTSEWAIVATTSAITHAANDATSLERFPAHLGDELRIDAHRGDWLLVEGPDGTRAYLQTSDVQVARR